MTTHPIERTGGIWKKTLTSTVEEGPLVYVSVALIIAAGIWFAQSKGWEALPLLVTAFGMPILARRSRSVSFNGVQDIVITDRWFGRVTQQTLPAEELLAISARWQPKLTAPVYEIHLHLRNKSTCIVYAYKVYRDPERKNAVIRHAQEIGDILGKPCLREKGSIPSDNPLVEAWRKLTYGR